MVAAPGDVEDLLDFRRGEGGSSGSEFLGAGIVGHDEKSRRMLLWMVIVMMVVARLPAVACSYPSIRFVIREELA